MPESPQRRGNFSGRHISNDSLNIHRRSSSIITIYHDYQLLQSIYQYTSLYNTCLTNYQVNHRYQVSSSTEEIYIHHLLQNIIHDAFRSQTITTPSLPWPATKPASSSSTKIDDSFTCLVLLFSPVLDLEIYSRCTLPTGHIWNGNSSSLRNA